MHTLFNLGSPCKDISFVAGEILKGYEKAAIPITGIASYIGEIQIVSPCYGAEMTWDTLSMMKETGLIGSKDRIVFLGSMGSLSDKIKTMDLVVPTEAIADYLAQVFHAKSAKPDNFLLSRLEGILDERGKHYVKYKHGPDMGVFDPRLNHADYRHDVFCGDILGVDCGEVFAGMHFCERNGIKSATLLYCSDDPDSRIKEIPKEEFEKRAREKDLLINKIGHELVVGIG